MDDQHCNSNTKPSTTRTCNIDPCSSGSDEEECVDDPALAGTKLIVLLRLGSRLNRTRSPNPRPKVELTVTGHTLHLQFPSGWLAERPLTRGDLENERVWLLDAGFKLSWE